MLQRIQSIWLLLASVCAFASLTLPIYIGTDPQGIPSSELTAMPHFLLTVVTVIVGVLALITIFLYGNRQLQFRLCLVGIILEIILLILYYLEIKNWKGSLALSSLFHIGVLLFFFLAARGIHNDDKIIKESNRLR